MQSIVVINNSGWSELQASLRSLIEIFPRAELLVVEHGGDVETGDSFRFEFPEHTFIETAPNRTLDWLVGAGQRWSGNPDPLVMIVSDLVGLRPVYKEAKTWHPLSL